MLVCIVSFDISVLILRIFTVCFLFQFLLRDILQFKDSVNDTQRLLDNSKRTCNLLFGVGDGKV